MIVACFIQAVIAVMLLLIEIKRKKAATTWSTIISIRSQIFIFTALL